MFRSFPGRHLLFASLLGLILPAATSWAVTTVTIPAPFLSRSASPASLSVIDTLSIANNGGSPPVYSGQLNMENNDLVINVDESTGNPTTWEAQAQANLAMVTGMLKQGYNNGNWNGDGIVSSLVQDDVLHGDNNLGIGVLLNDTSGNGTGVPIYGGSAPWDGDSNVDIYSVLVKYTYRGDTLLSGTVSFQDIQNTLTGLNSSGPTLWPAGSFRYNGTTSFQDLTSALNSDNLAPNTYPLTVSFAQPGASLGAGGSAISVPEPSSLVLLVMAAGTLLLGPRRRSHLVRG